MKKKLIGIDIGGTSIKLAFLTWDGDIITKWEIPTHSENKGETILTDIVLTLENKMMQLALTKADFHAVGVGVPGPVQLTIGYLPAAVNLNGFGDFNVNDKLGALLGLPVITDNDANVAAVGEMWLGGGNRADNVVFITLGTGVGAGIIVNHQVISGFSGTGGEVGHMPIVSPNDDVYVTCNCGAKGCVETVCSATGIVRLATVALTKNQKTNSVLQGTELTAKVIFNAAKSGDTQAMEIVDTFAAYLAHTFELLSVTVNPEYFVIGGGVSKAGDYLIDAIKKHYGKNIFAPAAKGVEITLARLGNDAGTIGAARHARGIKIYD